MGGKRRADARIVRHHLVALIDEPLVPDDLEQPPDRLDVVVVERVIGVVHVDPEAHALGHRLPVADVAHHRLAAAARELGDTDLFLDAALVEDAELLLDLVLDRQPVGVPAGLARAVEAAHVLVAREHVLERTRQHVVDAGLTVGRRRPFVPGVERPALALLHALGEHVLVTPEGQHLLLERGPVVASTDFFEAHRSVLQK